MTPAVRCTTTSLAARHLADHLTSRGYEVVTYDFPTSEGPLGVVARLRGGWMVGDLRIAREGASFAPPIGAYDEQARYRLRRQATEWFNASGLMLDPTAQLRLDAFGVVLTPAGALADVHHLRSAY